MVRREAQHTRARVISGLKPQGCVDKEVAAKTQREVDAKWAGSAVPFSELSQDASISRRFGLAQGSGENSKTRLIDDLSDSGINQAVQVCESPQPHTLDVLACLLLECLEAFPRSGFSGRSFDLKAACRQLGLSAEALTDSCVAFHDHASGAQPSTNSSRYRSVQRDRCTPSFVSFIQSGPLDVRRSLRSKCLLWLGEMGNEASFRFIFPSRLILPVEPFPWLCRSHCLLRNTLGHQERFDLLLYNTCILPDMFHELPQIWLVHSCILLMGFGHAVCSSSSSGCVRHLKIFSKGLWAVSRELARGLRLIKTSSR